MMNHLLTPEHVALILGIPTETVNALVEAGELSFCKIGEHVRFTKGQAQAFIDASVARMMGDEESEEEPKKEPKPLKHLSVD